MWWYTADLHIDHTWVAGWRGFSNVYQHDRAIINGWKSVVKPRDVVVVCGDIFWTDYNINAVLNLWKSLPGNKIIVKGNHDRWLKKAKLNYRRIYQRAVKYGDEKYYIVACHYPMQSWNRKRYGAIHVHGHTHGEMAPIIGRVDVTVDSAHIMFGEWRPFSLEEVLYLGGAK